MGKMQRQKGKRGERMLAAELRLAFPELADGVRRGTQSRRGTDEADVVGVPGYWFESKCVARFNARALEQAVAACGGAIPIAVVRADRKEPVAMLRLKDLLDLMKRLRVHGHE